MKPIRVHLDLPCQKEFTGKGYNWRNWYVDLNAVQIHPGVHVYEACGECNNCKAHTYKYLDKICVDDLGGSSLADSESIKLWFEGEWPDLIRSLQKLHNVKV